MKLVHATLLALAAALMAPAADAQTSYPDRPVRIIVGFTAGSATDITARMFAQKLQAAWYIPVTVENIPGAAGSVGGDRVAKAASDGTTLYWGANGAMTINPTLLPNTTFDPVRDLAPIARVLVMPSLLAVNNDVPAQSVAALFALAKARPGQLSYASPGAGTPQHIAGELLKSLAGVDIVHVPYRGVNLTDVIGGRVTMTLQNMGAILPVVREQKLRALAVTTLAESGFSGFEAISWFGLLAPAGTSAPVIAKVHADIAKIAAEAEMRQRLAQLGLDVAVSSPDELAAVIKADIAKWAKVIKEANIKTEE